jgi:glycosyltransferase involved in cell wall biosynthesis
MKKLLYVAPHLSTGGLPQYLVKKVELLRDEFEVYVVEWSNHTGGVLVVQRDKIVNLVDSDKFFELGENKMELIDIIDRVQPDIVHLEEIPEYFMDFEVARKIYREDRPYFLVETSHDSSYDTTNKSFFPDKFLFVSEWQVQQYKNIDVPAKVVYYPIEYQDRPDRTEALQHLGLDPNKKHILHVGLFTPRKNQAEFFEYARMLPEYEFHCVGNQAGNFKHYWEPLMENKPSNVTWWDERKDVDNFYRAMDLFLFTSRGSNNDKETMPLVIRESISWNMNLLIYNLPVYLNYFDQFDTVNYLDFTDKEKNAQIIKSQLGGGNVVNEQKEAFVISTYPVTDSITNTTLDCIKSVQKHGHKVILTSHVPIPDVLQEVADYCVVDKNNILTKHTYYSNFYWNSGLYNAHLNLKGEDNDVYHGPTVYTNYYNGASLASELGFDKLFFLNYDYLLQDNNEIKNISNILNKKDYYFGNHHPVEGDALFTYFFASKTKPFIKTLPLIKNTTQYNTLMEIYGAESNGLENLFYHIFKNQNLHRVPEEDFKSLSERIFAHQDFSRIEYFTILPTNIPKHFAPYFYISNSKDSRTIYYKVYKDGELIIDRELEINQKYSFWDLLKFEGEYKVEFNIGDTSGLLETKTFIIDQDYFNNVLPNNGSFEWKGKMPSFNIKLMHLVTEPDTNEKEIRSIESVKDFCDKTGIKYEQRVNKIWTDLPPKDNCHRPDDVQDKPGYYKLAPGHYGCFVAHTDAILAEDNKDYDYVLIFEGDVIVDSDYQELYDALVRFSRLAEENDQDLIGFGNPWQERNLNGPKIEDIYTDVTPFIPAQSYLINRSKLLYIQDKVRTTPWDAFDMWVCNVARLRVGTAEKIYTKHLPGFSIIEQEFKGTDNHSPLIYATE